MPDQIDEAGIVRELRKVVAANGSQKETARVLCISQYLCDILAGRREVSASIAELLGYERRVTYVALRPGLPAQRRRGSARGERP